MAIRVENGAEVEFGPLDAETVVTHARVGFGTQVLTVRPLAQNKTIDANGKGVFDIGDIDLVFPSGQLDDDGLSEVLKLYFEQAVWIDIMTDDSTVVSAGGYSQQTLNNWTRTKEND